MATQARGLHNFISDIRNASTKEAEVGAEFGGLLHCLSPSCVARRASTHPPPNVGTNARPPTLQLKRVEKELANIRQKFNSPEKLNSYHKKKYVWKLVYIFVLG